MVQSALVAQGGGGEPKAQAEKLSPKQGLSNTQAAAGPLHSFVVRQLGGVKVVVVVVTVLVVVAVLVVVVTVLVVVVTVPVVVVVTVGVVVPIPVVVPEPATVTVSPQLADARQNARQNAGTGGTQAKARIRRFYTGSGYRNTSPWPVGSAGSSRLCRVRPCKPGRRSSKTA